MSDCINILHQARFYLRTNWLHAVKILEDGIDLHPKSIDLSLELADIHNQKKSYKKALQYYQKVLNLEPKHPFARFKLANVYLDMDEPRLALMQYEKIGDDFPEAKYNKAIAYYRLMMYDEAIQVLKEIVDSNGAIHNAYYLLVELLISVGRLKEGMVYLDKTVEIHGNSPNVHYLKGTAFSYQKNWLSAYSEFMKALPGYTDNAKIYIKLGIAAENIGQVDKAIQHLKDAIRFNDEDKLAVIEFIKILVKYKIVADKEELAELMKEHDKETVTMALKFYENFVLQEKKRN